MPDETRRVVTAQELPTNPFIDVAMFILLEDIAEKQGAEGLHDYMISQGTALAGVMPAENYPVWEDLVASVNEGRSILCGLEGMVYTAGYCLATPVCPFREAYGTYIRVMGELLPAHQRVTDYYNGKVMNAAVESTCLIHQAFRKEVVKRVTVAGQPVRYSQMMCKGYNSTIKFAPEGWLEVLVERAGINSTQLVMFTRQNACLALIYPPPRGDTAGGEVTQAIEAAGGAVRPAEAAAEPVKPAKAAAAPEVAEEAKPE